MICCVADSTLGGGANVVSATMISCTSHKALISTKPYKISSLDTMLEEYNIPIITKELLYEFLATKVEDFGLWKNKTAIFHV